MIFSIIYQYHKVDEPNPSFEVMQGKLVLLLHHHYSTQNGNFSYSTLFFLQHSFFFYIFLERVGYAYVTWRKNK